MLARRLILRDLAGLAVGCTTMGIGPAWCAFGPLSGSGLRGLREQGAIVAIGRRYLADFPAEHAIAPLLMALARSLAIPPRKLLSLPGDDLWCRMRTRRLHELANGDTVLLDGWIVARSEAQLCALAALL